jgi:hypothetical protein
MQYGPTPASPARRYLIIGIAVVLVVCLVWVVYAFTGPRRYRSVSNMVTSVLVLLGVSWVTIKIFQD